MLAISVESASSLFHITSQYLPKYVLAHTILVIYWKTDLSRKFNLNLSYILIKVWEFNNQYNILYKVFYKKFVKVN